MLTAIRSFLLVLAKQEHDEMREPKLREEFLDETVKVIDEIETKYQDEWAHYLELLCRMCKEEDTNRLRSHAESVMAKVLYFNSNEGKSNSKDLLLQGTNYDKFFFLFFKHPSKPLS